MHQEEAIRMKRILLLVAAAMIFATHGSAFADGVGKDIIGAADAYFSNHPADGYYVSADNVLKRIQSGKKDFVIVDVRMPKEKTYDKGHIPGAIFIGYKDIAKAENLVKLPKDKDIILYCNTGHEESKVLTFLRMLDYKAYGLKWGYMAWKTEPPTGLTLKAIEGSIANNYPVEK
jgi:rhodanese-related sulfurtransferase